MDFEKIKNQLKQKTTLVGIAQAILGLIMVYTGHPDIGGGLITAGIALIVYQHREAK